MCRGIQTARKCLAQLHYPILWKSEGWCTWKEGWNSFPTAAAEVFMSLPLTIRIHWSWAWLLIKVNDPLTLYPWTICGLVLITWTWTRAISVPSTFLGILDTGRERLNYPAHWLKFFFPLSGQKQALPVNHCVENDRRNNCALTNLRESLKAGLKKISVQMWGTAKTLAYTLIKTHLQEISIYLTILLEALEVFCYGLEGTIWTHAFLGGLIAVILKEKGTGKRKRKWRRDRLN